MPLKKKRRVKKNKAPKQKEPSNNGIFKFIQEQPAEIKTICRKEMLINNEYPHQKTSLPKENRACTSKKIFKQYQKPTKIENYEEKSIYSTEIKRIYSPFNKFATKKEMNKEKKMPPFHSQYKTSGLSPKEKSYVISSCEAKSSRYSYLKSLAANAIKYNKIFSIYGSCNPIRKALLERGWVEKMEPKNMNLTRIRNGTFSNKTDIHSELERLLLSNLVEKYLPNLVWTSNEANYDCTPIDMKLDCTTVFNKLNVDTLWTTKQGLCSSIKRNYWFHIEDVAEVNGPRTYDTYDVGEIDSFINDYKTTACTSLLKWVLSMVENKYPIFTNSGKISINVLVFALNRCKEYLFRKQNKDIDHNITGPGKSQWNTFLKMYYSIISKVNVFKADKDNRVPMYLDYAKILLKEIYRYRPQLSCEGCHNIWIIKPAHCSRGRGIRMASKLGVITNLLYKANSKYVIQKYIEEPLLIHDTKFDIRQYYLVTSTYPLVVWMYRDCYLKFSSQKYNLNNYHESIHLTNNAVQKKYINCSNRHPDLPSYNMWDLDTYKEYLRCIGKTKVWDNLIYPGMRKSIISIMLSCQDSLTVSKNRFELYGCDFVLDKEYKPWLIEINSSPDLNSTTKVTSKICPAVINDIVKVVIDYAEDSGSSTGKFERIYQQPMSTPRYGGAADLVIKGYALPNEYFYKGTIEIKDSFDTTNISCYENARDLQDVLNKLKLCYDYDIMKPSAKDDDVMIPRCLPNDEDDGVLPCYLPNACAHISKSENELNAEATVITGQLDDLLDRITSVTTSGSKSIDKLESSEFLSAKESKVKSLTGMLSLIKKSKNKLESYSILIKPLKSNKPDDELSSNVDLVEHENFKKALFEMELSHVKELKELRSKMPQMNLSPVVSKNNFNYSDISRAASKLLSFINDKQKEYLNQ